MRHHSLVKVSGDVCPAPNLVHESSPDSASMLSAGTAAAQIVFSAPSRLKRQTSSMPTDIRARALRPVLQALFFSIAFVLSTNPALAQPALTSDDYRAAERFLPQNVNDLVYGQVSGVEWLPDGRILYRNTIPEGTEFVVVDLERGTRERAFDHERLAESLEAVLDQPVNPYGLRITGFTPMEDGRGIGFELDRRRWECDVMQYICERPATDVEVITGGVASPDGNLMAFRRDDNLWIQDIRTGDEIQLTTDGEPFYGYAADSEGWRRSDRPALSWSPDSRRIFTHRLNEREVGEMVLWRTTDGRPELVSYRYAIPGDSIVPMYEWIIVDVESRSVTPVQMDADHQRTSSCCGMLRGDALGDVEWSADGNTVARVSTSRDYSTVTLRMIDAATGSTREVMTETVEPFFEATTAGRGIPNWRVLHDRGEVLWFSQRSGRGHLYVHDLSSGAEVRAITSGEWNVVDVLYLDDQHVYFTGAGREDGRDPYHRHFYRVPLAGGDTELLTPEDGDHVVVLREDGGPLFIDSYSQLDIPPVTVLRRLDGSHVMDLERADISALEEIGWPMPIPFTVKARDGETDIHGVMYRPSNFDPSKSYPIINHIYPGPQVGSVGPRTFRAARGGNAQALAELGFIVVQIDALGTPMRSMDIHAYYFGDLGDNGLDDQIAGMRELASRYDWIDLDRVGIYGHSGGGFATARALLAHPDFFHVGVASAGNHDNRGYTYYWGEKWQGQLVKFEDGTDSYTNQANHLLAENLQGKLLISYGTLDSNVHPNTTLQLVDALIRANKDFDLMVFPNRGHGYANEPYNLRITWDYFVRHLLGADPPAGHRIGG
jgi:dipeptidyl-peptidase 4